VVSGLRLTCHGKARMRTMSVLGPKLSSRTEARDVCFSNRPFGVKRFQTIHHQSVDVARGLVLLFGIGTRALPPWGSKTRRNNLLVGLAVKRTAGPSGHTNSPHPSSREGHLSTAGWISSFLLSGLILNGFHAAAAAAPGSTGTRCRQPRCGA
jgi:hypothetical protein